MSCGGKLGKSDTRHLECDQDVRLPPPKRPLGNNGYFSGMQQRCAAVEQWFGYWLVVPAAWLLINLWTLVRAVMVTPVMLLWGALPSLPRAPAHRCCNRCEARAQRCSNRCDARCDACEQRLTAWLAPLNKILVATLGLILAPLGSFLGWIAMRGAYPLLCCIVWTLGLLFALLGLAGRRAWFWVCPRRGVTRSRYTVHVVGARRVTLSHHQQLPTYLLPQTPTATSASATMDAVSLELSNETSMPCNVVVGVGQQPEDTWRIHAFARAVVPLNLKRGQETVISATFVPVDPTTTRRRAATAARLPGERVYDEPERKEFLQAHPEQDPIRHAPAMTADPTKSHVTILVCIAAAADSKNNTDTAL